MMERRNVNRGFKKLRVWNDAVDLFVISVRIFSKFPFELKRSASNAIDAAHSIIRNIAEGYCRRGLKEYLNHLNIALGSCGEFYSCYNSFREAELLDKKEYENIDKLHYKLENELLKLIKSLQMKLADNNWDDNFLKVNE